MIDKEAIMILEIKNKYRFNKEEAKKIIRKIVREILDEEKEEINPYILTKEEIEETVLKKNKGYK
jgi:hypothetical protein